jgi:transposase
VSEVVRLQELLAQKEAQIQNLQADNQRQAQEIKLLKERVDLLIRRIFGTKSEQLDAAQLELLLKETDPGKADASTEKVEATPIVENLKPAAKRAGNNQRRERWPEELEVEQEVIEPEEIKENPEAFRCIGEEVTETLDYRPAKFFRHQIIRREFVRRQEPELTRYPGR